MKIPSTRKFVIWTVVMIAAGFVIYRIGFMPIPVSVYRVSAGQVIAEVMGTGTLKRVSGPRWERKFRDV